MENMYKEIIEYFGSQKELADRMGLTEGAVSQFFNGGKGLPAIRCIQIERWSYGKFRAVDLIEGNRIYKNRL